jgi:hypothetical protein
MSSSDIVSRAVAVLGRCEVLTVDTKTRAHGKFDIGDELRALMEAADQAWTALDYINEHNESFNGWKVAAEADDSLFDALDNLARAVLGETEQ